MQAQEFIRKWGPVGTAFELNELAGAQSHFIDLCRLLGVAEQADPDEYCFERGVTRTGSAASRTDGFADVWMRGHFAWEYKAPGKSLEVALKQLMMYALPLDNPLLLVVSNRLRIELHTHFTGTPSEKHVFLLEEMGRPEVQQRLRALRLSPDCLAQPARVDRAFRRGRAAGHVAIAVPGPHRRESRLREGSRKAHTDQPLQPAPGPARAGPRGAGPCRRRRLWLDRLHKRDARR